MCGTACGTNRGLQVRFRAFSISFLMASERLAELLQASKRLISSLGSLTEKTSPRPVAGRPLFRLIFTANGLDPSE